MLYAQLGSILQSDIGAVGLWSGNTLLKETIANNSITAYHIAVSTVTLKFRALLRSNYYYTGHTPSRDYFQIIRVK